MANDVLPNCETVYDKGYKDGLVKAWEIAKKIVLDEARGGYTGAECVEIFGTYSGDAILINNTVFRVLEEIEAYEKKKTETGEYKELKYGKWEQDKCTNCGKSLEDLFEGEFYYDCEELHFCPNCGAKMGGGLEQKAEKDKIKEGDEVSLDDGAKGVVVYSDTDGHLNVVNAFGSMRSYNATEVIKTGRHFPQMVEMMKEMRDNDESN